MVSLKWVGSDGVGEEEGGWDHGLEEDHLAIYLHGRDLDGSSEEVPAGGYSDIHGPIGSIYFTHPTICHTSRHGFTDPIFHGSHIIAIHYIHTTSR